METRATIEKSTDIREGDWIDRHLPGFWRPYARLARLDRPIGTWLLLFPCWWSALLAVPEGKIWTGRTVGLLVLFAIGALVMRGAGCTINDIVDRRIDSKVARTATRPLASGALTLFQAIVFLVLELGLGLSILLLLSPFAIKLGVSSVILIVLYPFMKRVTWWPQAFLGLTFNWGALLGWAAMRDGLDWPSLFLYIGGIFWTLSYDTIYAHQDKADDILVGVRSTALRFGAKTIPWLLAFDAAATIFFAFSFALAGLGGMAYVGLAIAALHLMWQALSVDLDNSKDCLAKFRANRFVGWAILAAICLGRAWQ